jgi:hypothetical protein
MPAIDFSEIKDLDPVPNGQYDAEITYAQEGTSASGNPKIDLRWRILNGEYAGRMVFDTLAFHPNALFRVKNTLKALNFPPNFSGEVSGADLIGLQATIVLVVEDGGTSESGEAYGARNRVSKVRPLASGLDGLLS